MVSKVNIAVIIQARMGSNRLPGKVLRNICGMPMLWHIYNRLSSIPEIAEIIIATSDLKKDDEIDIMAKKYGINCFRGSESDVLKRYFLAAERNNVDHIIRITGDCPLSDQAVIQDLIKLYFQGDYDFCGIACGAGVDNQINIKKFPDGLDAEIFSFEVLDKANNEATDELHREHVTPYIWKNPNRFKLGTLFSRTDYSKYRLTVDNKEDFEFIKWIYESLYYDNPNFKLEDIIRLLELNSSKIKNKIFLGKEGYDEFWK